MTGVGKTSTGGRDGSVIGIEFISVLGMPPVAFVDLARDLGCRTIGLSLEPIVLADDYAPWSLRDDPALRRDLAKALTDQDVSISLGEGFLLTPSYDVSRTMRDLDLFAGLDVPRINMLVAEADRGLAFDMRGAFAEAVAARGMTTLIEFVPGLPVIADLPSAMAAVRHVARADFAVLVDAMHLFRSGSTAADVAGLDPATIGYVQLCDVPLISRHASYGEEARHDRLTPAKASCRLARCSKHCLQASRWGSRCRCLPGTAPASHPDNMSPEHCRLRAACAAERIRRVRDVVPHQFGSILRARRAF